MNVHVSGHRSKKAKQFLAQAAEFYGSLLLSKSMMCNIDLDIILRKELDGGAHGYCMYNGKTGKVREFEIELNKSLPFEDILINLAHELTHLKQFATGELNNTIRPANHSKWQGVLVNEDKVDYWDLPWEIEAHGRERGLYYRFQDSLNPYELQKLHQYK